MNRDNKRKCIATAGFTLIELMITVGIVVLVTGLVLIQYSSFNSSVLLKSQAYAVAFDLREAQSLAISVRGQGGQFREEYGIYFDENTPSSYILFQDDNSISNDSPAQYNEGEQVGNVILLDPRFEIRDICVDDECDEVDNVTVTFKRPDFDADFYTAGTSNIQLVKIHLSAINDEDFSKTVVVYQTGQIEVQ